MATAEDVMRGQIVALNDALGQMQCNNAWRRQKMKRRAPTAEVAVVIAEMPKTTRMATTT